MCHSQMAPKGLIADTVGAQVMDCLGAVAVAEALALGDHEYRTANLYITVSSHCDERCHVGRIASLIIRRRQADAAPSAR